MLRIEIAASDGQSHVNEDCVGHFGPAAWVIDGATGVGGRLTEEASDAAWLARTASRLLAETLEREPDMPTRDLLRAVMAQCGEALEQAKVREPEAAHELPSAAFAMVRVIDGEAEFTALADCRIAALDADGCPRLFGSSELDVHADRTLTAVRGLLAENPAMTSRDLHEHLLPGLQATRQRMNREGGYWVLGTNPAAADHLWQERVPLQPGSRFAVASDGFLRLVELFDVAGPEHLLAMAGPDDWAHWLTRLRDLEAEPGSLPRFPRVKVHDDASVVVCRWSGVPEEGGVAVE